MTERVEKIDDNTHKVSFEFGVSVNVYTSTLRDSLGKLLRRFADKIDGRRTLAWRLDSDPALTDDEHVECLLAGARLAQNSMIALVKERANDEAMRHIYPGLHSEEKT